MPPNSFPSDPERFFTRFAAFHELPAATRERHTTLDGLIDAWGNHTWAAWKEYLVGCLEAVETATGPILECGAGLSSLIIADHALRHGLKLWTLEENEAWAKHIAALADRLALPNLTLVYAPIRDYDGYRWYDAPLERLPKRFGVVACDGPAAHQAPYNRYGLVPVMGERLQPGGTILLDDGARDAEREIAERWAATLNTRAERIGVDKPFFRIRIPE